MTAREFFVCVRDTPLVPPTQRAEARVWGNTKERAHTRDGRRSGSERAEAAAAAYDRAATDHYEGFAKTNSAIGGPSGRYIDPQRTTMEEAKRRRLAYNIERRAKYVTEYPERKAEYNAKRRARRAAIKAGA